MTMQCVCVCFDIVAHGNDGMLSGSLLIYSFWNTIIILIFLPQAVLSQQNRLLDFILLNTWSQIFLRLQERVIWFAKVTVVHVAELTSRLCCTFTSWSCTSIIFVGLLGACDMLVMFCCSGWMLWLYLFFLHWFPHSLLQKTKNKVRLLPHGLDK